MKNLTCSLLAFAVLCATALPAIAQGPPSTDILLVEIANGAIHTAPEGPVNLTDRDGYDNQPFFTPDGQAVLYTSSRGEQTDIYRVDVQTRTAEQVTNTPESEYSPTPLPTGEGFSTIRVEADGTQRLWRFDAQGQHPALVLEAIKPVGYHAWADAQTLALFVLGSPPTLQQADTHTGQADTLIYGVGRSLHRMPGTAAISFVHKETEATWTIKTLDPESGTIKPVTQTMPGREDYAWHPDGSLLMADGPVLHIWKPEHDGWKPLYDFSSHGVTTITRLAVSPDGTRLALVANRP